MVKIKVIGVGNIKEKYLKDAINEYLKRLLKYVKFEIIEVKEEEIYKNSSEERVKEIEGERILEKINSNNSSSNNSYVIGLDLNKKEYDSIEFSKHLSNLINIDLKNEIVFVIGGSLGLGENIKKRLNESITLSKLTFPHQLVRVILLEQIYRSFKIMNNETYHK